MRNKYLPYFENGPRWHGSNRVLYQEHLDEITFRVNCCRKRHEITITDGGQIILHDHTEDQAERFVLAALCGPVPVTRCEEVRDEIFECFRYGSSLPTDALKKVPKVLWDMIRTRHSLRRCGTGFKAPTIRGPVVHDTTEYQRSYRFCEWATSLCSEFQLQTGKNRAPYPHRTGAGASVAISTMSSMHSRNIRTAKSDPVLLWFQKYWRADDHGHKLFYAVKGESTTQALEVLLPRVQVVSLHGPEDLGIVAWADPNGRAAQHQCVAWARVKRAPIVIQDEGTDQRLSHNTRIHGLQSKVPRIVLGWYAEILEML